MARLAARFVPGFNIVSTLTQDVTWLLNGVQQLTVVFDKFLNALPDLGKKDANAVAN